MNKNSKRIQYIIRNARKARQDSVTVEVPVDNYHSNPVLTKVTRPVVSGGGTVSKNSRRNMCMRVLTNPGGGANSSITRHEKLDDAASAWPKPRMDSGEKNKRAGIRTND